MKRFAYFILAVAVLFWIAIFAGGTESTPEPKTKTRSEQIEAQFNPWNDSHIQLTQVIKRSMNDPDSYEHVQTQYWDHQDHLVVITTFRGKNAFGGVVQNYIKAKVDMNGNVLEILEQGQ